MVLFPGFAYSPLDQIRGNPQLREFGRELAAFHQLGVSLDDFKSRLLVLAPEPDVEAVLADAKVEHGQVGQPGGSAGSTYSLSRGASGRNPSSACISMKTEPAAQACGTLAPRYCTGKFVSSRSDAV